jgi:hypothetical protein
MPSESEHRISKQDLPIVLNIFRTEVVLAISFSLRESAYQLQMSEKAHIMKYGSPESQPF